MVDSNQQPRQMGRQTMRNPSNKGLQDGRMRRVAVMFAAAGLLVVAGCGTDDDGGSNDTTSPTATASESVVTLADSVTAAPTVPVCTLAGGAQCDGQPSDTAVEEPPAVEEASEGFEILPLPEGATVKFSQAMLFDPQDGQCKAWLAEARPLSPEVAYPEGTVGTTTTSVDGKTTTTVFRCEDGEWVQVGEP